jgi:hypothetical protein
MSELPEARRDAKARAMTPSSRRVSHIRAPSIDAACDRLNVGETIIFIARIF